MRYGTKGTTWDSSFKLPSHDTSVCVPLSETENCSSVALEEQLAFINIANNSWEGWGAFKQLQKQVQLIFHDNQSCTSGAHALRFIALHPSRFMKPHSVHLACYLFLSAKFKIFFRPGTALLPACLDFVSADEELRGVTSLPNRLATGLQLCPLAVPLEANNAKADLPITTLVRALSKWSRQSEALDKVLMGQHSRK